MTRSEIEWRDIADFPGYQVSNKGEVLIETMAGVFKESCPNFVTEKFMAYCYAKDIK